MRRFEPTLVLRFIWLKLNCRNLKRLRKRSPQRRRQSQSPPWNMVVDNLWANGQVEASDSLCFCLRVLCREDLQKSSFCILSRHLMVRRHVSASLCCFCFSFLIFSLLTVVSFWLGVGGFSFLQEPEKAKTAVPAKTETKAKVQCGGEMIWRSWQL